MAFHNLRKQTQRQGRDVDVPDLPAYRHALLEEWPRASCVALIMPAPTQPAERVGETTLIAHRKLGTLRYAADELDLPVVTEEVALPEMSEDTAQRLQERLLGVSTGEHMLARWRAALTERGYLASGNVLATPAGQRIRLIGTVAMHQAPPTAKGFHFLTLEDEQGMLNVVVRPYLAPLARTHAHPGVLLEIEGVAQHEAGVTNVQASWMRQRTLSRS